MSAKNDKYLKNIDMYQYRYVDFLFQNEKCERLADGKEIGNPVFCENLIVLNSEYFFSLQSLKTKESNI